MKLRVLLLFVVVSIGAQGQALRDINYNYVYEDDEQFQLVMHPVRSQTEWNVFYELNVFDAALKNNLYIEWGIRESLNDKESKPLDTADSLQRLKGVLSIPVASSSQILVAKVINRIAKRGWLFFKTLEVNSPVTAYLQKDSSVAHSAFVNYPSTYFVKGLSGGVVSYYNDVFPAALPPFSETQGRVSKQMKSDSVFSLAGSEINFNKTGLYLIQRDTLATEGVAVRAEADYPKLARIETLSGPLVYITTLQEHNRLLQAKGDKKTFDKVVLGITNDRDRAVRLMRNYFKRVAFANRKFTSYKEGWKTDRGMIYIVFGLPDEVYRFSDREIWNYELENRQVSFTFIKSSSVFDPDNYVLLRDKKYQQAWYETIDLWRNARF